MKRAGLVPDGSGSFDAALEYANPELALRAFLAAGIATRIERQAGAQSWCGRRLAEAPAPFGGAGRARQLRQ